MSSNIEDVLQQFRLENSLIYAAAALSCYDYFLTLGREVRFVWKTKHSPITVLFYVSRYPALFNTIFVILGFLSWPSWQTSESCVIIIVFEMVGYVLILASSATLAAMRVCALFNRNTRLFALLLIIGMINPAISLVSIIEVPTGHATDLSKYTFIISRIALETASPAYQSCVIQRHDMASKNRWMICARASSLLYDGLVFMLTWSRTRFCRKFQSYEGIKPSVNEVLLRDAAQYFSLLLLANAVGVAIGIRRIELVEVISMWIAVLTSILLSHLIIDLREMLHETTCAENSSHATGAVQATLDTLHFRQVEHDSDSEIESEDWH